MEVTSWFCVVAAVVSLAALLQGAGCWTWALVSGPVLALALVLVSGTRKTVPVQSRAVLITGVLDLNGVGAQQLQEHEDLQVLQLDVTDGSQIETAYRRVCAQVAETGLWGLVNNAGVLRCPADAELLPLLTYRLCVDVNFLAAVRMCQVFLPLLRRSRGRIVNVSSMAGLVPMPMFAAYGASKAALSVFSQAMRLEVTPWGVDVSVIHPTGFRTSLFGSREDGARYRDEIVTAASSEAREDYGEAYISSLPGRLATMSQQSAEDLSPVLDAMCDALLSAQPAPVYCPGSMGWLLPFLQRWCPSAVLDAVLIKLLKHDCEPAGLSS